MKRSSDSIDRLVVKQLTLESKNGSVILSVGNDGKINFLPYNKNETGSFSIDLKNEKITTKKIEFRKDDSFFTSSLGTGGGISIADSKFDSGTGRLLDIYTPTDYSNIRNDSLKGVEAINKFGNDGKLLDANIRTGLLNDITKGVEAINKFGNDGKLLDANIRTGLLNDITKGVGAADKFGNDGKLLDANIRTGLLNDITKGVGAADKFGNDGKLLDANIRTGLLNDITKGVGAADKFGNDGKLLDANIRTGLLNDITKGVGAYNDFGDLDFSLDITNPSVPIIKLSRGSRGFSTTNFSKSSIGLSNVENKSSTIIRGEITVDAATGKLVGIGTSNVVVDREKTFTDSRFTNVQTNASNGSTAFGYFNSGFLKDANTPSGLKNSNITVDVNGALQGIGTGVGAIVNNNNIGISQAQNGTITITRGTGLANLTTNPLSTTTFTNVQTNASNGSTAFGYFNSGFLKDANTPSGLKNSNITVDVNGALQGIGTSNVVVDREKTFTDSRFTNVQTTANTVKNRFSENGRLLEQNSLNNSVRYFSPGNSLNSSPQENDQAILAGTDGAIGYSLIYGTKIYDFNQNIPNSSNTFSNLFVFLTTEPPSNSNINNLYLNSYFKSEFSISNENSQGIVRYLSRINSAVISTYTNKRGFISNSSTESYLTFNNLFYGPIIIKINYNPVQLINTTYWSADNYNGHSAEPPFFKIQTRQDNSASWNNSNTGFKDENNNNLNVGNVISKTEGIKNNNIKTVFKTENLSGFNQIRICFDSIANSKAFIIESIEITSWFRSTDPDVLSKIYQLADNSNFSFTFTGQHKCSFIDELNSPKEGLIVVSNGEYDNVSTEELIDKRYRPSIDESVPKVKLSTIKNDKSVFGVISKKSNNSKFLNPIFPENGQKNIFSDNRYEINSLGEGAIWVCNINGNLENGDYITTCEIPGYGMKQDDDLLHNYTVAKITCDCDFDLNSSIYICEEFEFEGKTYKKAFVGCTYHCG